MKRKLKIVMVLFISISLLVSSIFAAEKSLTILDASETSESYMFNNEKGVITQKIGNIDNDKKVISVETTVKNTEEELTENEVIFVIDGSLSTAYTSNHEDLYYNRYLEISKNLAERLLEKEDVKVGAVFAYGRKYEFDYDKAINCWTDDYDYLDVEVVPEYSTPVEMAPEVATNPTSNLTDFNTAIDDMINVPTELGMSWQTKVLTNLQAGIQKAEEIFSDTAKTKTIIIISDGIITEDNKGNYFGPAEYPYFNYYTSDLWEEQDIRESETQVVYSNIMTNEEIDSIKASIYTNTINEINSLKDKDIAVETIICGYENDEDVYEDDDWGYVDWDVNEYGLYTGTEIYDEPIEYTYDSIAKDSRLTYHNLSKYEQMEAIENTIIDNYNTASTTATKVKLDIVLSEEILANYELTEVGTPSLGTALANAAKDTITWNIEDLPNDEVKTLEFKLKLKDNYDVATASQITRISKNISIKVKNNASEIIEPNPAIKIEETYSEVVDNKNTSKASNPKTGDVIKRHLHTASIAIGIFAFARFAIKYGTKKKKIIY